VRGRVGQHDVPSDDTLSQAPGSGVIISIAMESTVDPRASSTLASLFAYKAWANEELFAALAAIDAGAHPAELHGAIRVLNHVHVVDCIFKGHLSGAPHGYAATNTKETPALAALAAAVRDVDAWYVAYVGGLSPTALQESIRFTFTDGDTGSMTREEILLHVITHGGYHRGQAGQVMRSAASAPPRDLYTRFLHLSEPARRG
jgi:uncharacterized damage-inducible protein DinB